MHELAIAESVVASVLRRTNGPVRVVRLRVGRLAGGFCFELATAGTALEGARLDIENQQGRARCRTCEDEFVSGRDLSLVSVEVA